MEAEASKTVADAEWISAGVAEASVDAEWSLADASEALVDASTGATSLIGWVDAE